MNDPQPQQPPPVTARALGPLPEITAADADELAPLLSALHDFSADDLLVLSHKVVSKAEGRAVPLADVAVSAAAEQLCRKLGRTDPRLVELVLRESSELIRAERGVLIARTAHGFVCANAGIDSSNSGGEQIAILLPICPDRSARRLRARLPGRPAVVIADSFGRAWRSGQAEVAIGVAGLLALDDWRGRRDRDGRTLTATAIAIADQAAAAADLARGGKDSGRPAVLITGLQRFITTDDGPGIAPLLRSRADDLFGAR